MSKVYINCLKKSIFVVLIFLVSSCALKPITSQYNFIKIELEDFDLNELGNGKVLIYNGADVLHKLDNTARLNIWIGNKALGQLRGNEYVVVSLDKGTHEFKVLHIDVVNMRSYHSVKINEDTKVLRIEPTLTSNKLTETNKLPKRFAKFKYAEKR